MAAPQALSAPDFIAFCGGELLAAGSLPDVARAAKLATDAGVPRAVQVLHARTSVPRDLDLGGSIDDVLARLGHEDGLPGAGTPTASHEVPEASAAPVRTGPGRPRLGVVAREVTLLPRHWAWLNEQSGGASAALRRLVDEARGTHALRDEKRRALDSVYRFLHATLGDAPGFEEATRALYAGNEARFVTESEAWPPDLKSHAATLARAAFHPASGVGAAAADDGGGR